MSTSGMKRLLMLFMFHVIGLVFIAAWSHATPLPAFKEALAAYRGQTPLVIGARDGYSHGESFHRRNYVLLFSFKVVEVTQMGSARPEVREETRVFTAIVWVIYAVAIISWWRRSDEGERVT